MRCGAVQSKASERFEEACCMSLAGGRKGGEQLAAGQSIVDGCYGWAAVRWDGRFVMERSVEGNSRPG